MQIGVVSDTHNNFKNIEKIISIFNAENITTVIHTGDITNANSLDKFSQLKSNFVCVYGNNDRQEPGLVEIAKKNNFQIHEPPATIHLHNRNIAIFHEPDSIEEYLLRNKDIDIALHGHTHRYRNEVKNKTVVFNPGESAGFITGKNALGIINLVNLEIKRIFF